jgi:hypothetical protein
MSIFGNDIFGGAAQGADDLSTLMRWRGMFPGIPSAAELRGRGVTHYTTAVISSGVQRFDFYNAAGAKVSSSTQRHRLAHEITIAPTVHPPGPARQEGDGLLPSPVRPPQIVAPPSGSGWSRPDDITLFIALLLGVPMVIGGGIVYLAMRKKKVKKNRRRRTTRRRR